jgi:L-threonylcarbamoyladenylate synthase
LPLVVVDPVAVAPESLDEVRRWLMSGRLVIFPTDTFYGLGAVPAQAESVRAIFDVKGRDDRQAVPIIAASLEVVRQVIGSSWSDSLDRLARGFWPGPLSLVVRAPAGVVADAVHGGLGTIAVRVPDNAVARAVAAAAGGLVTATSANRSGAPPVRQAGALDAVALDPRVLIVDGGETPGGAPSTIVDLESGAPQIVRAGAISPDRVMAAWSESG